MLTLNTLKTHIVNLFMFFYAFVLQLQSNFLKAFSAKAHILIGINKDIAHSSRLCLPGLSDKLVLKIVDLYLYFDIPAEKIS